MPSLSDQQVPEGGAGWYPDPLGDLYKQRYFDGRLWTLKIRSIHAAASSPRNDRRGSLWTRFTAEIGKWPMPVKIIAGIFVAIFVISAINRIFGSSNDSSSQSQVSNAPAKSHRVPPTALERKEAAFAAQQKQAVEFKESVADSIDYDESPLIRCTGQTRCGVTYEIEELAGFDTEEELVFDQRDVWAALFANPRFRGGFIELEGPVESVGGKVSVEPLLIVRCDRAADNQIDWENVTAEGLKQLCRWEPEVNLE